jgi:putative CocE/NonD family hydrolase
VHLFVMGANEWWEADTWPLPQTEYRRCFLHGDGSGGEFEGGGTLSFAAPDDEPPDRYVHDPLDPVRSPWSMHGGPVDDRTIAVRGDVLTYASGDLDEPLDVVGPVTLVLFAASSAPDVDWHARLLDIGGDGAMRLVCHGVLRARYRDSFEQPSLLEPDVATRFEVPLTPTAHRFRRGHRIAIEIASSWFPRFERNMGSGARNNLKDADARTSTQTVQHSAAVPSHVLLPIPPAEARRPVAFAPRTSASEQVDGG